MPARHMAAIAALAGLCLGQAAAEPPAQRVAAAQSAPVNAAPAKSEPAEVQLAAVRKGHVAVPAYVRRNVPDILASEARAGVRKRIFLKTVLPAILRANAQIRRERRFLARVAGRRVAGEPLEPRTRRRLERLAERYETQPGDLATLRRRADIVPPALALAQAAIESGWGGSRFAQKANALFGQRAYGCDGCGIKPRGYDDDPGFRVQRFPTVTACVRAYMNNLNTHQAYRAFREQRLAARRSGDDLEARDLAGALIRYSERREAYVQDVRRTIAANDLTEFDGARLAGRPGARQISR